MERPSTATQGSYLRGGGERERERKKMKEKSDKKKRKKWRSEQIRQLMEKGKRREKKVM